MYQQITLEYCLMQCNAIFYIQGKFHPAIFALLHLYTISPRIRPDRLLFKKNNMIHCNSSSLKFAGSEVERGENKRW